MRPVIAVIGGTGLENPEIMKDKKELETQTTPWGEASTICTGIVGGEKIFILSRHGKNHDKSPTQGKTSYLAPFGGCREQNDDLKFSELLRKYVGIETVRSDVYCSNNSLWKSQGRIQTR